MKFKENLIDTFIGKSKPERKRDYKKKDCNGAMDQQTGPMNQPMDRQTLFQSYQSCLELTVCIAVNNCVTEGYVHKTMNGLLDNGTKTNIKKINAKLI